jgi:hypothetical protein
MGAGCQGAACSGNGICSLTYFMPGPLKMNGFDLFVFIYRHIIDNSSKIALSAAGIIYSGCFSKTA